MSRLLPATVAAMSLAISGVVILLSKLENSNILMISRVLPDKEGDDLKQSFTLAGIFNIIGGVFGVLLCIMVLLGTAQWFAIVWGVIAVLGAIFASITVLWKYMAKDLSDENLIKAYVDRANRWLVTTGYLTPKEGENGQLDYISGERKLGSQDELDQIAMADILYNISDPAFASVEECQKLLKNVTGLIKPEQLEAVVKYMIGNMAPSLDAGVIETAIKTLPLSDKDVLRNRIERTRDFIAALRLSDNAKILEDSTVGQYDNSTISQRLDAILGVISGGTAVGIGAPELALRENTSLTDDIINRIAAKINENAVALTFDKLVDVPRNASPSALESYLEKQVGAVLTRLNHPAVTSTAGPILGLTKDRINLLKVLINIIKADRISVRDPKAKSEAYYNAMEGWMDIARNSEKRADVLALLPVDAIRLPLIQAAAWSLNPAYNATGKLSDIAVEARKLFGDLSSATQRTLNDNLFLKQIVVYMRDNNHLLETDADNLAFAKLVYPEIVQERKLLARIDRIERRGLVVPLTFKVSGQPDVTKTSDVWLIEAKSAVTAGNLDMAESIIKAIEDNLRVAAAAPVVAAPAPVVAAPAPAPVVAAPAAVVAAAPVAPAAMLVPALPMKAPAEGIQTPDVAAAVEAVKTKSWVGGDIVITAKDALPTLEINYAKEGVQHIDLHSDRLRYFKGSSVEFVVRNAVNQINLRQQSATKALYTPKTQGAAGSLEDIDTRIDTDTTWMNAEAQSIFMTARQYLAEGNVAIIENYIADLQAYIAGLDFGTIPAAYANYSQDLERIITILQALVNPANRDAILARKDDKISVLDNPPAGLEKVFDRKNIQALAKAA